MKFDPDFLTKWKTELDPFRARLIVVSKTQPGQKILDVYAAGQRDFGENYVQELVEKQPQLPADIRWHFIGHLQTNKVKQIAGFIDCIHTVDSVRLLKEIDRQAAKHQRVISCLLQVHIADETTKFGMSFDEAEALLAEIAQTPVQHVSIIGLMGMATNTEDLSQVRKEFRLLNLFLKRMKVLHPELMELSMGMSTDYRIALEEGSTMVRVGSAVFGPRNYPAVG